MAGGNQMSMDFEKRAFGNITAGDSFRQLCCTLITGFLGSGKTTLMKHIQRQKGDMKIAFLVNEFGEMDVDSLILKTLNGNAALGIPNVQLANGCACCSVSGELKSAVKQIQHNKHMFDHLVIETSGIADPGPIAAILEACGARLEKVVTVVDAENLETIMSSPVAKRQLAVADVVLVNKCDTSTLSQISDVEDWVEAELEKVGGRSQVLRTRFCDVPLDLVMEMGLAGITEPLANTTANAAEGFLSHESSANVLGQVWSNEKMSKEATHHGVSKRAVTFQEVALHEDEAFVSLVVTLDKPLFLAKFQNFVTFHLRLTKTLLRAKGLLWFQEKRKLRYIFHLSGKQRCEAKSDGQWESPPATQVVLIGRKKIDLENLREALSNTVFAGESNELGEEKYFLCKQSFKVLPEVSHCWSEEGAIQKAEEFKELFRGDERFIVIESTSIHNPSTINFGLKGFPLKGIRECHLNERLMRDVNERGRLFISDAGISKQANYLQLGFTKSFIVGDVWDELSFVASRVLRKALQNNCNCRCDITLAMKDGNSHIHVHN